MGIVYEREIQTLSMFRAFLLERKEETAIINHLHTGKRDEEEFGGWEHKN